MGTVETELMSLQIRLGDGYQVRGINGFETCTDIAKHIAFMLLDGGQEPEVLQFSHRLDAFYRAEKPLSPVPYRGQELEWNMHRICACADMAYDPIFGEPVPLAKYSVRAFGEQIEPKLYADTSSLRKSNKVRKSLANKE